MKWRGDDAWRHGIDADVVLDQFLGQPPSHGGDESLGACIQRGTCTAAVTRSHRGHVDHHTAMALLAHGLYCSSRAHHGRAHVQIDHVVKQFIGDLFNGHPLDQSASVVDQSVDAAKSLDGFIHEPLALRRFEHIAFEQNGLRARGLDAAQDFFGRPLAAVVMHGHAGTQLAKGHGGGCANAGARAGDQNHFVFQIVQHASLLFIECVHSKGAGSNSLWVGLFSGPIKWATSSGHCPEHRKTFFRIGPDTG